MRRWVAFAAAVWLYMAGCTPAAWAQFSVQEQANLPNVNAPPRPPDTFTPQVPRFEPPSPGGGDDSTPSATSSVGTEASGETPSSTGASAPSTGTTAIPSAGATSVAASVGGPSAPMSDDLPGTSAVPRGPAALLPRAGTAPGPTPQKPKGGSLHAQPLISLFIVIMVVVAVLVPVRRRGAVAPARPVRPTRKRLAQPLDTAATGTANKVWEI